MNKIVILGRLVRDPEVRQTQGQNPQDVALFTVAVNRRFSKDKADFIPCQVWGKRAAVIGQYFHKGSRIALEGRLQIDNNKQQDGSYKTYVNVNVDDFEFVDPAQNGQAAPAPQAAPAATPAPQAAPPAQDGFMSIPEGMEDELPFI